LAKLVFVSTSLSLAWTICVSLGTWNPTSYGRHLVYSKICLTLGLKIFKTQILPTKIFAPFLGSWWFSIPGFTWAFEARISKIQKKGKNQKFERKL